MSGLDPHALDRWITDGRYSEERIVVTCPDCCEDTNVLAVTDYGTTEWEPAECHACNREFTGEEGHDADEPPEPDFPGPDPGPSDCYDPRIDHPERYSDGPI